MIFSDLTILCGFLPLLRFTKATLSMDFDEEFRDCENGNPMPAVDFSEFEIIPQSDGSITMNGSFRFVEDYENPTRWNFYTKRLQRGEWIPGIVSRDIPNLCPILQMPYELWYPFTRYLERKHCPFKAGHVEHVKDVNIGNMATVFRVPPDFIGEWQIYHEITTTRNGRPFDECVMVPVTISEV